MKINKLRFFAKKSATSRVRKEVEFGYQPSDRDILSFMHENKPIDLDGVKYSVYDIYAEPTKKTILTEAIIAVILGFAINFYFQISTAEKRLLVSICLLMILSLVGIARIDKQKRMAEKFNNS